jgi:small-conductance mechanosensitive channel/CRP-like cAMP-binding protein
MGDGPGEGREGAPMVRRLLLPLVALTGALVPAVLSSWAPYRAPAWAPAWVPGALALPSAAMAWLAAAWLASRIVDLLIARAARPGQPHLPRLLRDLARIVIAAVAAMGLLAFVLGQPVTGVIATSGVVVAVVGFALRNMIADVVSGIALNIESPYRLGDWVELALGTTGRVDEITWRSTRLATLEGTAIIVPNGVMAGSRFVNISHGGRAFRAALTVTLDQEVPVDRARRILAAAAVCARGVRDEPPPDVVIEALTPNGVVYQVRFWVPGYDRLAAVRDAVASAIAQQLGRAGIALALPRQDVQLHHRLVAPPSTAGTGRALLRQLDLFQPFADDEIDELARALRHHHLPAGQPAVRQGEDGSSLFLVAEGVLDVTMAADGRPLLLDRMQSGDVFGEMSLLTGQTRSASVIACTDAIVYELDKDHLDPVLRRRPELAAQLAHLMAGRQHRNAARTIAGTGAGDSPATAMPRDLLARLRSFFKL